MREFLFFGKKEKINEPEQISENGLVEKFSSAAKILALFTAFNFPTALQAETGKDNDPERQEQALAATKVGLDRLMTFAKTDSRWTSGEIQGGENNGAPGRGYKEYRGEKADVMIENSGAFTVVSQNLLTENGDKKTGVIFFDENSDGKLDRLVVNEDEEKNHLIDNVPYLFNSLEVINGLSKARARSGLGQEKISAYSFDHLNKIIVHLDGFKGEREDLSGEGAARLIKIAQEQYSLLIEELNRENEKNL